MEQVEKYVEDFEDFPIKGVTFKDVSSVLANYELRKSVMNGLYEMVHGLGITHIAGNEARGFLGVFLADMLKCGFVMIRKPGKLPGETEKVDYSLEYGKNTFELRKGLLKSTDRVLIFDDLLATGGSAGAAKTLVEKTGATVVGVAVMVELEALKGRANLQPVPVFSYLRYDSNGHFVFPKTELINPYFKLPALRSSQNTQEYVLMYHPTMENIAKQILVSFPGVFRLGNVSWKRFPDGYPNISFDSMEKLEGRHLVFLGSLYDHGLLFEQLSLCMALTRQFLESMHVVFPYFAPVDIDNTLATAETMAKLVSFSMTGIRPTLRILDIHALQERFYFTDHVGLKLMSVIPTLLLNYINLRWQNKCTIAFPDEGACKRFKPLLPPDMPMIICTKMRDGDKRDIEITQCLNWVEGRDNLANVLILDDLVQSGGTLHECRKALEKRGAKRISCFVTHAVFPNGCYGEFLEGRSREGFDTFICTDSVPESVKFLEGKKPFEVLSIAPFLGADILKLQELTARHFEITLGSENEDKISAIKYVFEYMFPLHEIIVIPTSHEPTVSKQPFGQEEIERGATDRATVHYYNHATIGIENGLIEKEGGLYDVAIICIRITSMDRTEDTAKFLYDRTEEIRIPDKIAQEWLSLPNRKDVTIGELMEKSYGYNRSNWHLKVSGKSRSYLLSKPIERLLKRIYH